MARLEVSIHELPTKVNTGELHRLVMELYNPSKSPVRVSYLRATQIVLIICSVIFYSRCILYNLSIVSQKQWGKCFIFDCMYGIGRESNSRPCSQMYYWLVKLGIWTWSFPAALRWKGVRRANMNWCMWIMAVERTIMEYFLFQRFEALVFIQMMYIVNELIFTSQVTHSLCVQAARQIH